MLRHTVDTCPDDPALLQERLDGLAELGARIVSVAWQAHRVIETDQSSALDARGSFVIVAEHREAAILRERHPVGEAFDEMDAGRA